VACSAGLVAFPAESVRTMECDVVPGMCAQPKPAILCVVGGTHIETIPIPFKRPKVLGAGRTAGPGYAILWKLFVVRKSENSSI
jgi:hypothetical protein